MENQTLTDLARTLEKQKENSLDVVADSRTLEARAKGNEISLKVPGYGEFPLTEWAHGQLADKLGIPKGYYDRMRKADKAELLSENINAWMKDKDRRLVRVLDNRIRAVLSDRYRIMDNYGLLFLALSEFRKKETIQIYQANLTETMLYVKAVDITLTAEIREKDVIQGGLIIRNSEVGASAFRVEPFLLRRICSNGLIGEYSLKKIHLGRERTETGEMDWDKETRELEDRTLQAKVREIIRKTFEKHVFESWVNKLRQSAEATIEEPVKAVDHLVKLAGLTEEQKNEILVRFSEPTRYGLLNAVTSLARDAKSVDEQIRLEELGGKLLSGPEMSEARGE